MNIFGVQRIPYVKIDNDTACLYRRYACQCTHFCIYYYICIVSIAEYGVLKKFILTYGVVGEFECKDFQPVHISVPADRQLIVFSASYGSTSHPDRDVTQAVVKYLVKDNAVSNMYKYTLTLHALFRVYANECKSIKSSN